MIQDFGDMCPRCGGSYYSGHEVGCPIGISKKEKQERSEVNMGMIAIATVVVFFVFLAIVVLMGLN